MFCDGQSLSVPANLHSALHRLRQIANTLVFRADALCINQSAEPRSLRERSAQVQSMGQIYLEAEQVVVDTGDSNHDSNTAFHLAKNV